MKIEYYPTKKWKKEKFELEIQEENTATLK
jgi:hypothetical protein